MRVPQFVTIVILAALLPAAGWAQKTEKGAKLNCLDCHSDKIDGAQFSAGAHAPLDCAGCHEVAKFPHQPKPARPKCAACHENEVKEYGGSLHGQSRAAGHPEAAACQDCHGSVHALKAASDPASKVAKANLPATCGACHSNPALVAKFHIPIARPIEAYQQSVHGRAIQRGVTAAPACSDCHGSHALFAAADLRSKVNRAHVPATCGACHSRIAEVYRQSVHGRAAAKGMSDAPVCTDCHGEHGIRAHLDASSATYATHVSRDLCGNCHNDRRLAEKFNMPADRASTYFESYHGLASRSGSKNVANCASCHGVHDIRASSDPLSAVNPANLARTCGKCHANAGQRFALGRIHVPANKGATPLGGMVRSFYLVLIPLIVGGMFLHCLVDLRYKERMRRLFGIQPHAADGRTMSLNERIQHLMLAISFIILVITGFALKFPESFWARPIVAWEGKWAARAWIHRGAAVILISAAVYHLVYVLVSRPGRRHWMQLVPLRRDVVEFFAAARQYLGGPQATLSTYNYIHKAEYWALVWGTIVMGVTGAVLWFNDFTLRYLPRWVIDLSTIIHYYEAVLAALAVLVWHGYSVIFDPAHYPMDWLWLDGVHHHKSALGDHSAEAEPAARQNPGG
jgi:formate dehydrogenase gamma subunit